MRRHKFLWILAILVAAYVLWLGYEVIRFKPYRSRLTANGPEVEGVYHLHSTFSDGRKDIEDIARIAAGEGVQFLVLTDHGSPNYKSLSAQGWKSGVLVLAGSELSVSRGHLVALGFQPPDKPFPQNAEDSLREIRHQGGFTVIAHPFSKVPWTWGGNEGDSAIEVINGDTELRYHFLKSLPWLPALLIKPRLALIKMLGNPAQSLAKWDEQSLKHPVYGYFSSDAHMLYGPLFSFLRIHIFLKQPLAADFATARNQVFEALRTGKFYNAVDAAAPARGFRFWAVKNWKRIPMGRELQAPLPVTLRIRAPYRFPKEVRLVRDGRKVFSTKKSLCAFTATAPGVYRVEVYLTGRTALAKDVPWIVSNPIFLREDKR